MFYRLMAQKYANIRTFKPEDGTGAGADTNEVTEVAEAEAEAAKAAKGAHEAAEAEAEAAKAVKDAQEAAAAAQNDSTKTDAEKAALLREVMEKKSELKDLRTKLKEFEGVDVAAYRQMVADREAAELKAATDRGEFERVREMMASTHKTEKEALEAQLAALRADLDVRERTIDELSIGNAFGNSTFIASDLILSPAKTRALYGSHFDVVDGKVVGYDKPRGAANRTPLVDGQGVELAFEAALRQIIDADADKESVLRSKAKAGAGSDTVRTPKTKAAQPELRGLDLIKAGLEKMNSES